MTKAREAERTRVHITVSGRVQGVGYRWFAQRSARALSLAGWVRNLDNGDVELEAEGPANSVDVFIDRLRTGNPHAQVHDIQVERLAPGRDQARNAIDFEIRF